MRKIIGIVSMLLVAAIALAGCSGESSNASITPQKDTIKAESIVLSAAPAIIDEEDCVAVSFENKSGFKIVGVKVEYGWKDGVDADQIESAFSDTLKGYSSSKSITEYEPFAEIEVPTEVGKQSVEAPLYLNYYWNVETMDQYELMEPVRLELVYLANKTLLYRELYSYKTGAYSLSSEVVDTSAWGIGEAAQKLPRCTAGVQISMEEYESSGTMYADYVGVSTDEYLAYVKTCKEAGFTKDSLEYDDWYSAKDEEGNYSMHASYEPDKQTLEVRVSTVKE